MVFMHYWRIFHGSKKKKKEVDEREEDTANGKRN
jgi:hypothetical protein